MIRGGLRAAKRATISRTEADLVLGLHCQDYWHSCARWRSRGYVVINIDESRIYCGRGAEEQRIAPTGAGSLAPAFHETHADDASSFIGVVAETGQTFGAVVLKGTNRMPLRDVTHTEKSQPLRVFWSPRTSFVVCVFFSFAPACGC